MRVFLTLSNICGAYYCNSSSHKTDLDEIWWRFTEIERKEGKYDFGPTRRTPHSIPGWNSHVKVLYEQSMRAFLHWRQSGSPRNDLLADCMR